MKKYTKQISDTVVYALERLGYEYETRKDNIAFLMNQNSSNPDFVDSPLFEKYQKQEIEAKKAFEKAKKEFETTYIPKELRQHEIKWNLDYHTKTLTVTQLCDCDIEVEL